jgi:hypothetical protein
MAKKTKKKTKKKTAQSPTVERAVARAEKRARRFRDRLDHLDEWIDRDPTIQRDGRANLPFRGDLCDAEYRRRIDEFGSEDAPTFHQFAHGAWRQDELFALVDDLKLAANRLALLADYKPDDREPIDELLRRVRGTKQATAWRKKTDLEVLRGTIEGFKRLLSHGVVERVVAAEKRPPSPLEAAILRVLVNADGMLSCEEIASKVQRALQRPTTREGVKAAIHKLRSACGLSDLRAAHGGGYRLTPALASIATRLLGKG